MAFWADFKAFAVKGNVLDLAVAVVIGGAFGKIVSAFVADIIMPIVSLLSPGKAEWRTWTVGGAVKVGDFMGALLDFLIIALVLFIVVQKMMSRFRGAVVTKACPECLESIPLAAKRCRACTAVQPS